MTTLPAGTPGGVHDVLTVPDAARLTTRIQFKLETITEGIEGVLPLIEQARAGDAHQVLGYPSWTAYVADKFGGTLARLRRVERVPFVELLAEQGMSTRAIASVASVGKSTVADDLASTGVRNRTPADPTPGDLATEQVTTIPTTARNVTGIDGKSYPVPPPKPASKPRRGPLPDAYRDAVWELEKAVQRLVRLHEDDRFLGHRDQLSGGRIASLNALLSDIENDLDGHHRCRDCGDRLPIRGYALRCEECGGHR